MSSRSFSWSEWKSREHFAFAYGKKEEMNKRRDNTPLLPPFFTLIPFGQIFFFIIFEIALKTCIALAGSERKEVSFFFSS